MLAIIIYMPEPASHKVQRSGKNNVPSQEPHGFLQLGDKRLHPTRAGRGRQLTNQLLQAPHPPHEGPFQATPGELVIGKLWGDEGV